MNWTGGRLRRHAGSHGNERLTAQRMHFAYARKHPHKQGAQSLLPPTQIFSVQLNKSESQQAPTSDYQTPAPDISAPTQGQLHHRPQRHSLNVAEIHDNNTGPAADMDDSLKGFPRAHYHRKITSNIRKRNLDSRKGSETEATRLIPASMDAMKNKLLAQPDWLGLSTHRPVEIDCTSMTSIARIGRHKKIKRSAEPGTSKQLLGHESQKENYVKSVTGKRKRSDHEEVSHNGSDQECIKLRVHAPMLINPAKPQRPHDTGRCQLNNISVFRPYNSQPRTPLKDSNRQHYHLSSQDLSPEDHRTDLLSLDEVRTLQNFDAVKLLHLQLRKHRSKVKNGSPGDIAHEKCQPPSSSLPLSKQSGHGCANSMVQDTALLPVNTINIARTKNFAARDLEQTQGSAKLFFSPESVRNGQNPQPDLVDSSSDRCALHSGVLPILDNQEPRIAVKDFAVTSPTVSGPEYMQTNRLGGHKYTTGRFHLESPKLGVCNMPSIFARNVPEACKAPLELPDHMDHLVTDSATSRSRVIIEPHHNTPINQRSHESKHISTSAAISSPYFSCNEGLITAPHDGEETMSLAQRPNGSLERQLSYHLVEDVKGAGTRCLPVNWKRSLTPASHLQLDGRMTVVAQPPPHLKASLSSLEQVRQQEYSSSRSSSMFRAQRGTPVTIFSTPPRRFEGTQPGSRQQESSPYFQTSKSG